MIIENDNENIVELNFTYAIELKKYEEEVSKITNSIVESYFDPEQHCAYVKNVHNEYVKMYDERLAEKYNHDENLSTINAEPEFFYSGILELIKYNINFFNEYNNFNLLEYVNEDQIMLNDIYLHNHFNHVDDSYDSVIGVDFSVLLIIKQINYIKLIDVEIGKHIDSFLIKKFQGKEKYEFLKHIKFNIDSLIND